jgi:hypothetical protein
MLSKYPAEQIHTVELPEFFAAIRTQMPFQSHTVWSDASAWNGGLSFDAALDAAEFGKWSAPKIEALTIPQIEGESEEMRYSYDVIGQTLDIAAFLSGEPECWQVEEPIRKPCGRVIRLAVEIGGLADIDAAQLTNRGQAIIALVNSLELAGHSVEVTIVRAFHTKQKGGGRNNYRFLIPVKHAGQSLDMKRLQFMLGHAAFYRRCLFGISEVATGHSITKVTTYTDSYEPAGFMHIPHKEGLMNSLSAALDWAKRFADSLTATATATAAN